MHDHDPEHLALRPLEIGEVTRNHLRACGSAIIFLGLAAGTTACGDRSSVAVEARRVFDRAAPSGSSSCWDGNLRRLPAAFETSCEFRLSSEWNEYKRWIVGAMKPYIERNETADSITFSRAAEGDAYTVRVELLGDPPAQSVRLVFHAAAW